MPKFSVGLIAVFAATNYAAQLAELDNSAANTTVKCTPISMGDLRN